MNTSKGRRPSSTRADVHECVRRPLKSKFEEAIVPRGEITQMLQSWQSVDKNTKEQYVTRMLGKLHFV